MMRFFLKRPRFWGDLFISISVIASNIGSAWAGMEYQAFVMAPPFLNSAPADIGFQILIWTVYPFAAALLALGVYLRSRHRRS